MEGVNVMMQNAQNLTAREKKEPMIKIKVNAGYTFHTSNGYYSEGEEAVVKESEYISQTWKCTRIDDKQYTQEKVVKEIETQKAVNVAAVEVAEAVKTEDRVVPEKKKLLKK